MIAAVRTTGEVPFSPPKTHPALMGVPGAPIGPVRSAVAMTLCNQLEVDVVLCGTEGNSLLNG